MAGYRETIPGPNGYDRTLVTGPYGSFSYVEISWEEADFLVKRDKIESDLRKERMRRIRELKNGG